jgi:hypothetical protein
MVSIVCLQINQITSKLLDSEWIDNTAKHQTDLSEKIDSWKMIS